MNTAEIIISFFLGIVASIFATFLFPTINTYFGAMFVRFFGWIPFGRHASFVGIWKATWHVKSDRYPPQVVDDSAVIKQFGNRIYARTKAGKIDCYLVGTIDNGRYITGTWYDDPEGGYHGAFQFVVDPSTRNFSGRWIGFSTVGIIKEGLWEWQRKS